MTDKRDLIDDADAEAAEYALRLLTGDELRAAKERVRSDPDFAAAVARWRGRLAPLEAETIAVSPPPSLWESIEAALGERFASNDNVIILRRKLHLWRSATGAMTALAASLALFLAFGPRPAAVQPAQVHQGAGTPMVAMLGDKSAIKVVASCDPTARQLVLAVPGDMPADARHAHELWIIPAGGRPRSLGTMPAGKQMHMRLADALADLLQRGATIAISIEPPGGSPTGAPTGPVVASGALTRA